jgi:translation initiation factor IF-1
MPRLMKTPEVEIKIRRGDIVKVLPDPTGGILANVG